MPEVTPQVAELGFEFGSLDPELVPVDVRNVQIVETC